MSISPKILYQSSAILFLLSAFAHGKMGGDIINPALQPLGNSNGATLAKMGCVAGMTGSGYLLACSIMVHKFSYTPAEQLTQNDTIFMFVIWFTNLYGSWTFWKLKSKQGMIMLFTRSSLLVAARVVQML